jgi:hypothetical protein
MSRLCIVPFLLLLVAGTAARAGDDDPAAYLAEARKKHRDSTLLGLRSFSARLTLRRSEDESLRNAKDVAGFGYSFEAPGRESFDLEGTHASLRKPYQDTLRNLWRDVTGALWFDLMERATDLRLVRGNPLDVVAGTVENAGEVRLAFEAATGLLSQVEFVKAEAKADYLLEASERGPRVAVRDVSVRGTRALRLTYRAYRNVSGFDLPTVLGLATDKNATEYLVTYVTVNGEPARLGEIDAAEIKALVASFEKGWRGWSEAQKDREMLALSDVEDDLTAMAIARLGLRDRAPDVRAKAAEILGVMARRNVVPALIAAMKENEKEIVAYIRMIQALGEIGDPRAVDILSKDWWNQRIGEYGVAAAKAKIRALGNIRHVSSVDALLDTFSLMKDEAVARFKDDLIASLRTLTGQDFGYDRNAWKEWWKRNRASHRFE